MFSRVSRGIFQPSTHLYRKTSYVFRYISSQCESSTERRKYLLSGKTGSGLTISALSHVVELFQQNVDPSSIVILSNRLFERNLIEEVIDITAPLSSIETEVHGMSSFLRSITKEYSDILQNDEYRIVNDEEQYILFESNRQQLLANCTLYESNVLTTKSLLRNINTLQSLCISPSEYSNRLESLRKQTSSDMYKHYVDIGTVYALYDQFLQDRKVVSLNAILSKLVHDECTLKAIAKKYPMIVVCSAEYFSPLQNTFLSRLIGQPTCESALITHHSSITYNDFPSPVSIYESAIPSLTSIQRTTEGPNHAFIQLLDYRSHVKQQKTISEKDVEEWKRIKKTLPVKPSVCRWDETATHGNSVYVQECYSGIEEQEEIIQKIKEIFETTPSLPSPPSWTPSLQPLTSESSYSKVIQYLQERRVENKPMKHVIGVVFKTEKEVRQFCSLLDAEKLNYRSIGKEQPLYEGVNILRALYDPFSPKSSNFVDILQLESLKLQPATINAIIRKNRDEKTSFFVTIQQQLQQPSINMTEDEKQSLQILIKTIQTLHNQLLRYPGSFILYKFYESIQELPFIMANEQRQSSLLQLLSDLVYMEDGKFPLIEPSDRPTSGQFNRLHNYIDYLQFLPLNASLSIEQTPSLQHHPLMNYMKYHTTQPKEEEKEEVNENIIIVTTYGTYYPTYFTDLFLPQLNAGKIPSRRVATTSGLPEGVLLPSSPSLDPYINPYQLASFEFWLSRCLQPPHLSYSLYLQNKTNANMHFSKPSIILTSLLTPPKSTKAVKSIPSHTSAERVLIPDFDASGLYEEMDGQKHLLLSVSRMNTYFKCPFAFYLQYVLGLTGNPSFFLSYGSSIHGCIEDLTPLIYNESNREAFKDRIMKLPTDANIKALLNSSYNQENIRLLSEKYGEVISDNVMKKVMKHYWKTEDYTSPAHEQIMKLHYYKGIVHFIKRETARYFKNHNVTPLAIEKEFSKTDVVKVDGVKEHVCLRGVFDRIEGKQGKATCIVDYKSNPSRKELNKESFAESVKTYYGLQTACYIDAFSAVYGTKPKSMRFENVEEGITYTVDLKTVDMSIIEESITKFVRGIREGDFTPCLNEFHCNRCEFKDKCQHWTNKK